MCRYVTKKELSKPKNKSLEWLNRVHDYMKQNFGITFQHYPIGSGSINMVVEMCNRDTFDLDYELEIKSWKENVNIKDPKKIKQDFMDAFNNTKEMMFSDSKNSTQSITIKNKAEKYSLDFIITIKNDNGFYILRNNKNRNGANDNDYQWAKRSDSSLDRENMSKIDDSKKKNYLRDLYLGKRHAAKDIIEQDVKYKKSYQILNEAVNETLTHFHITLAK